MTPSPRAAADAPLAGAVADRIAGGFRDHLRGFRDLTRHARVHFEHRDWHATQRDSGERLDLYNASLADTLRDLHLLLGARAAERALWSEVRAAYIERITGTPDDDLAETYFNSVTRRVFHTIGVDPEVAFVTPASPYARAFRPPWSMTARFAPTPGEPGDALYGRILEHYRFAAAWDDAAGDARRIAAAVAEVEPEPREIELARAVFYRNKGAYLVGLLRGAAGERPFLLALTNPDGRVVTDAVLLTEDEVSIVFSFARSYFLVETERVREMAEFLRTIMPRKPVAELFNAIGFNKHGKTELYRSLLNHLRKTGDRFEVAPGQRGMVMAVFTLPGFDVVFKVLRDRFDHPKTVTHQEVLDKYRIVFRHDRAGRLVDAQQFEHLAFDRERFAPALLEELLESAANTVRLAGDRVVIRHLFTERRLRPLDLYLAETGAPSAREAVLDYGEVLRDLAATNIFPGDMLLKNFGVSRHGRLIFYDYDELCRLTDCNFRALPQARGVDEEMAAEPWFYVGERDIFPEEFRAFLGLKDELLEAFLSAHGELLGPDFWCGMQERHHRGEVLDVFPYKDARRLRRREASSHVDHEEPKS